MLRPDIFPPKVISLFTTRSGIKEGDLLQMSGMKALYLPIQRHTDRLIVVDGMMDRVVGDGVITRQKGLLLGVKVADCLPVLIYDPETETVSAVHAGWRGTAMAILRKTIRQLSQMGSRPENLLVAFGPSIRACCYRVGPEVVQALKEVTPGEDFIVNDKGDGLRVDLLKANIAQIIEEGISRDNIWYAKDCTCCNREFFSYRRDRTKDRQGGYIGLR